MYLKKIKEIEDKAKDLSPEFEHSQQVRKLAALIFDLLKNYHGLNQHSRFLLEGSALLHDLGLSVSVQNHNKISQRMIRDIDFEYVDKSERKLMANISRYHTKALPNPKHKTYSGLTEQEKNCVSKLAAILRIADGLDRNHTNSVKDIKVRKQNEKIIFILKGNISDTDIYGFNKKKDLFEKEFGYIAEVKTKAKDSR
jgi:exopolyphosphatase/guanosine-5'-triphosphate,3'-diphosphate pyrophosphatase